jgi:spore germination cell wall hydrolase CwlJ-like protein
MTAVSARDREILARTLWGEARGEGLAGQLAVAWTIRNRVFDGKQKSWWGEGYAGVCLAKWQFSCWNQNDPNYAYLSGAKPIPAGQFKQAMEAANAVIDGTVDDMTGGATHYYATSMPKPPAWVKGAKLTLAMGHHKFYTDVP